MGTIAQHAKKYRRKMSKDPSRLLSFQQARRTVQSRCMWRVAIFLAFFLVSAAAQPLPPKREVKKEKEKEEITQTLAALPEPPSTVIAETAKLQFHVAPLSA